MFRNNIAFKGICVIILFITMGVSQVSITIENVDLTAGTLDIFMKNIAGCSTCDDSSFDNQVGCEVSGNNTQGGTWTFDASIDAVTCAGECSTGTYTEQTLCTDAGVCNDNTSITETLCTTAGATWTPNTWTDADTNGVYFDGKVKAFQFYLEGITITGISGGTAEQYLDFVEYSKIISGKIIGTSTGAAFIPVGDGTATKLTTVTFSNPENLICVADTDCSSGACSNDIANTAGVPVDTDWGICFCATDEDSDGVCDGDDNCLGLANSVTDCDGDSTTPQEQCDADGDGKGDVCDTTCPYDKDNDADADGICDCTLIDAECNALVAVADDNCPAVPNADQLDTDGDDKGDVCDTCMYDSTNDADGDGICYCTLDDCSAVTNIDNCKAKPNANQADGDGDGVGDVCDNCPILANSVSDCDGFATTEDKQCDADFDDVGNVCDNCVYNANKNQSDRDGDGFGDKCDNCENNSNAGQADVDFDFIGDVCDLCPDDEDNILDCFGVCGGSSIVDVCGICGGGVTDSAVCQCDSGVEVDCAGVCGGPSVIDCTGTCGGSAVEDPCGVCGGTGPADNNHDCDGNCIFVTGTTPNTVVGEDCAGVCGGSAVEDVCGICGGTIMELADCNCADTPTGENLNQYGLDCAGVCGGPAVEDICGVCGGTGPLENYNCQGGCISGVDCNGACGGPLIGEGSDGIGNDQCGICGGSGPLENYNCQGQCINLTVCGGLAISQIGSNLPAEFSISQNFPNPFNPVTSITFDVAEMDEVSLIVYDLTGKEVTTLVSGTYTPGTYNVEWNAVNNTGDGIVSGMYIYRYISSEKAITRKMLYLK